MNIFQLPILVTSQGITLPCQVIEMQLPDDAEPLTAETSAGTKVVQDQTAIVPDAEIDRPLMRIRISASWMSPAGHDKPEGGQTFLREFLVVPPEVLAGNMGATVFLIQEAKCVPDNMCVRCGVISMERGMELPHIPFDELLRSYGGDIMARSLEHYTSTITFRAYESEDIAFREFASAVCVKNLTLVGKVALRLLADITDKDHKTAAFHISAEQLISRFWGDVILKGRRSAEKSTTLTWRIPGDDRAAFEKLATRLHLSKTVTARLALYLLRNVANVPHDA